MEDNIRCAECRYARLDAHSSNKHWTAYECGNRFSAYYRGLVNITEDGDKLPHITWAGCPCGERRTVK